LLAVPQQEQQQQGEQVEEEQQGVLGAQGMVIEDE